MKLGKRRSEKGDDDMKKKAYKIVVKGGKGIDQIGIERDYSEWIKDGTILVNPATDEYPFEVWRIKDAKGRLVREKDWGRNVGKPVYPDRAKVWFGKNSYVEVGYQRRKNGTFYATLQECFRPSAKRQRERYEASRLYSLVERVKESPSWNSLCYGIHLPDETKDAYKAAIDEALSGKYESEVLRDEI